MQGFILISAETPCGPAAAVVRNWNRLLFLGFCFFLGSILETHWSPWLWSWDLLNLAAVRVPLQLPIVSPGVWTPTRTRRAAPLSIIRADWTRAQRQITWNPQLLNPVEFLAVLLGFGVKKWLEHWWGGLIPEVGCPTAVIQYISTLGMHFIQSKCLYNVQSTEQHPTIGFHCFCFKVSHLPYGKREVLYPYSAGAHGFPWWLAIESIGNWY